MRHDKPSLVGLSIPYAATRARLLSIYGGGGVAAYPGTGGTFRVPTAELSPPPPAVSTAMLSPWVTDFVAGGSQKAKSICAPLIFFFARNAEHRGAAGPPR